MALLIPFVRQEKDRSKRRKVIHLTFPRHFFSLCKAAHHDQAMLIFFPFRVPQAGQTVSHKKEEKLECHTNGKDMIPLFYLIQRGYDPLLDGLKQPSSSIIVSN